MKKKSLGCCWRGDWPHARRRRGGRPEGTIAEIDRFLTSWHQAAAVADAGTYFDSLAPGAIFLGTDIGERWTREDFQKWAMPYFQRSSAWVFPRQPAPDLPVRRRQHGLVRRGPGISRTTGPAAVPASWKRSPVTGRSGSITWPSPFPTRRPEAIKPLRGGGPEK